jgi:hypothetical protein
MECASHPKVPFKTSIGRVGRLSKVLTVLSGKPGGFGVHLR